jgi:hypothetical protein
MLVAFIEGAAMNEHSLKVAIELLRDDAHAATFQSLGQYRSALLNLLSTHSSASPDPVVEANREMLLQRSVVGLKKYGVTLEDGGLSLRERLHHALEEALDLSNYMQAAIRAIDAGALAPKEQQAQAGEAESIADQIKAIQELIAVEDSMQIKCALQDELDEALATLQPQPQAVDEREAFENFAKEKFFDLDKDEHGYKSWPTQMAWQVWQDTRRAALSSKQEQEPVGEIVGDHPVHGWHFKPYKDWDRIGAGAKLYTRPPAPAQQGLTDEDILRIATGSEIGFVEDGKIIPLDPDSGIYVIRFARAIESALSAQPVSKGDA